LRFGSFNRTRVAVLLLLSGSLFSNLLLFIRSTRQLFWKPNSDYAAYRQQKSRLEEIPEILAARGCRIVGYDSDRQPGTLEYYLTQFILAPVLVANDPTRPLVIGNYHDQESIRAALASGTILKTTDGGMILIDRSPGR
jgi:hypothetical protein